MLARQRYVIYFFLDVKCIRLHEDTEIPLDIIFIGWRLKKIASFSKKNAEPLMKTDFITSTIKICFRGEWQV